MCLRRMWMRPVRPHLRRVLPRPPPRRRRPPRSAAPRSLLAALRHPEAAAVRSLPAAPWRPRAVVARGLPVAPRRLRLVMVPSRRRPAVARSLRAVTPVRHRRLAHRRQLRREVLRPLERPRDNLRHVREARRRPLAQALSQLRQALPRLRVPLLLPADPLPLDAAAVGPSRQRALGPRRWHLQTLLRGRAMALPMAMRMRVVWRRRRPFGGGRMRPGLI